MTAVDKIKIILANTKCGTHITVNQHKDYYQDIRSYVSEQPQFEDLDPEILSEIIRRDTVIEISAYVRTPVGAANSIHYDLDAALDEILEGMK